MKNTIKNIIKKNNYLYKFIKKIKDNIYYTNKNFKTIVIQLISCIFPIKENKIIISNYYGKSFGDNGKYIVEELIRRDVNTDIVWLVNYKFNQNIKFPEKVRLVKYGTIKSIFEQTTAKIIIDNCRRDYFIIKRKKQFYIQAWHASFWLKKIEADVEKNLSHEYVKMAKRDSKMADLIISGNHIATELFKNHFWYDGEVCECGNPRVDILLKDNKEIKEKIQKKYAIENKNIVLYAPTFRADNSLDAYNIDIQNLIKTLEDKFSNEWICLIRLHPNISEKSKKLNFKNKNIIDVSDYEDMSELMCASDILITDYSSVMFEFSYSMKPVFLYATDIKEYVKDRGFIINLNELPYSLSENNEKLKENIINFNSEEYKEKLDVFFKKIGLVEKGNASKTIVDKIIQIIN